MKENFQMKMFQMENDQNISFTSDLHKGLEKLFTLKQN